MTIPFLIDVFAFYILWLFIAALALFCVGLILSGLGLMVGFILVFREWVRSKE